VLTRLLILWLLSEQSLHGYRIKKILDDASLRFWFSIKFGSIYAVLRTLVREGYVETVAVEREGQRPERTRYAITANGRAHLGELLERSWRELPPPADPLDLALAAQAELGEARVRALAAERAQLLEQRIARLDELARSAPAPEMVERRRALTSADLAWVQGFLGEGGAEGE
jgi:DNA-binding PadR family transcriptional regulator